VQEVEEAEETELHGVEVQLEVVVEVGADFVYISEVEPEAVQEEDTEEQEDWEGWHMFRGTGGDEDTEDAGVFGVQCWEAGVA
jgi:hypothetical protein